MSGRGVMQRYSIQPVLEGDLGEIVQFLVSWHRRQQLDDPTSTPGSTDPGSVERNLRWLQVENPAHVQGSTLGHCIRDEDGTVAGTLLCFPGRFLHGQQRLRGLGSGSFFVDPAARMQGFFLFRKYFNVREYDFLYATSCNTFSGPLWTKLGGRPILSSAFEYMVPIRAGALAEALARSKRLPSLLVGTARLLGPPASALLSLARRTHRAIRVEPCHDWDRLAAVAERDRDRDRLCAERSAEYLEWRYARSPAAEKPQVYSFETARGEAGWFAVGMTRRGRHRQLAAAALLDLVWPRQSLRFADILPSAVEVVAQRCDLMVLSPPSHESLPVHRSGVIRRGLASPRSFILPTTEAGSSLAGAVEFVMADGDISD